MLKPLKKWLVKALFSVSTNYNHYNRVKRLGADNREAGKIADFFESMVKKDGNAKKSTLNNSYAKQIISELADGKADWVNRPTLMLFAEKSKTRRGGALVLNILY